MYRSIITVDDESVTMYLSCPAGKERTLGAAVRGALPRVAFIECPEDPLSGWIEKEKTVAGEFKAGDVFPHLIGYRVTGIAKRH